MTTSWQEQLALIRARAAANCGLGAYPADAIARAEDSATLRYDRMLWRSYLTQYDKTRKDRTR